MGIVGHNPLILESSSSLLCLNGGFTHKNQCICPPGFKGDNCDHGKKKKQLINWNYIILI